MAAPLLMVTMVWLVSADEFLRASPFTLEKELEDDSRERVQEFWQALEPSFAALPKNQAGNVQHQTARYILHRLFVQQRGWYIKGLEPNGDVFHAIENPDSFKEWVPSYLLIALEKRVGHQGLNLHDLAALGAALEGLIRNEATDLVKNIYHEYEENSRQATVEDVILVYVTSYLSNKFWDAASAFRSSTVFVKEYHRWAETRDWVKTIEDEHLGAVGHDAGVAVATKIAIDIGARYGAFNDQGCMELKGALMAMWGKGKTTGRVRLTDFYRMGLDTQWDLVEKIDYLRALGALDESNASSPMVIIPNYLTARPNCLEATNLYATCCRNECENILGHLERSIGAPSARPEHILTLIVTPKQLDGELVARLQQIAEQHGGKVKLHGRLFSQWMHHVYPTDCPYPHEAGSSSPSSPDQWLGVDVEASEQERRQFVDAESCGPEEAATQWSVELPWSPTEELLHDDSAQDSGSNAWCRKLLVLFGFGAGASAVMALLRQPDAAKKIAAMVEKVSLRMIVLVGLAFVGVLADLINPMLLIVMLCVGLLLQRSLNGYEKHKKIVEKSMI